MRHGIRWLAVLTVMATAPAALAGKGGGKPHAPSPPKVHAPSPPKVHANNNNFGAQQVNHANNANAHRANATAANPASAPYAAMFGIGGSVHHAYHNTGYSNYGHRYGRTYRNPNNSLAQARLRHLTKIKADLDSVAPGTTVSPNHKTTLQRDLMAVVHNAGRPAGASVHQLSQDVINALAHRKTPGVDTRDMTYALEAVMNPMNLSRAELNQAVRRGGSILKASGSPAADVKEVERSMNLLASNGNLAGLGVGLGAGVGLR